LPAEEGWYLQYVNHLGHLGALLRLVHIGDEQAAELVFDAR
jgi:hypothetical protein